ncbi:hypothetical protein [Methylobacterium sp. CM6247]
MIRTLFFAFYAFGLAVAQAHAQTASHDLGTDFGQSNRLMGWPVWIAVGVIVAAALLYTFGSPRGRSRK